MFSGIIETIGLINHLEIIGGCSKLTISPKLSFTDLKIGDSVSVNGACLTVTRCNNQSFDVTVVPETMRLTNLNDILIDQYVNLERSIKVGDRISGHYVQGHVDCRGKIIEIKHDNSDALLVKIELPQQYLKYIVPKGYVALDGMSITVIEVADTWFTITLIPHTQAVTIANQYRVEATVNLEVDILSKYVQSLIGEYKHATIS